MVLQSAGIERNKTCVALLTAEAEHITLAKAAQESIWLQQFLMDRNEYSVDPMTIFEDNQWTILNIIMHKYSLK